MIKAKKLPSGSWNVQVFVGFDDKGKKIRKSFTAPTKQEVEFLAAKFKTQHREIVKDSTSMTLSQAIDSYIEFKGGTLSPSTIRGYRFIQKKALQSIMNFKLNKLTVQKIQAAINAEVAVKKTKTLKNEVGFIKAVLKMYYPSLSLKGLTLPQREKFEATELTLQQVIILLNAVKEDSCAIPLLLAVCCGLRASEISALTWNDYNSAEHTINIRSALVRDSQGKMVKKSTKTTNSARILSIPKFLAIKLDDRIGDNSEHIVKVGQQTLRRHLEKICKDNDIPHIRLHDLRHINASIMLYLNIPQKYAMERGGWDNIQTMDKIYQFTFKDEKQMIDEKINDFFNTAMQ